MLSAKDWVLGTPPAVLIRAALTSAKTERLPGCGWQHSGAPVPG